MKAPRLIDYIKEINSISEALMSKAMKYNAIKKYVEFLNQPLKLEMFVPCDYKGEILEEPELKSDNYCYKKAKELGL